MHTLKELKRASKKEIEDSEGGISASQGQLRLAVLGNCATQLFSSALQGEGRLRGISLTVYDADYDQTEAELLNDASDTMRFHPDIVFLWFASPVLYEEFLSSSRDEQIRFADIVMARLVRYWELASERLPGVKIIQPLLPEIDDRVLGNLSAKTSVSFAYQMRKLNVFLQDEAAARGSVFLIDMLSVQRRFGGESFFDAPLYYSSRIPVAMDVIPHMAKETVDILEAIGGKVRKCVICDLDGTLWGGIIGDDGIGGIEIGELGAGRAFRMFQLWLKHLKECGIILAVCSKNDDAVAKEPFEKLPEMVLRLSDFSVFVANWEDKASNIRHIRDMLDIGLDSMVFLDDNPFERNLVRELVPEVTVPELPEDPALWLTFLQNENLFETAAFSAEIADRTVMYQQEAMRREALSSSATFEEYLQGLRMEAETEPFIPEHYARIAQLTQRSNQFNLRTIRYTEDDIRRMAEDPGYITLSFSLKDRFGDHGLISVVILHEEGAGEVFIDTWLMSCRVLKRGMEEYVMNEVVNTARREGLKVITAEYIPTAKNSMVSDIYVRMGFEPCGDNRYRLRLADYSDRSTFVG